MPKRFWRRRRSFPDGRREQRPGRIVSVDMTSPLSLPIVGVAAVVATILGLHLGNSAVAEINPIHFQGPALHPRDRGTAIDETELAARLARRPPSYDQLYGWPEAQAAYAVDCPGCGMRGGTRVYAASVPYFGSAEEIRAEDEAERRASDRRYEARLAEAAAEREARSKDVLRYADFPLTEDDASVPSRDEPDQTADE